MTVPSLNELKEIDELIAKIGLLESELSSLEKQKIDLITAQNKEIASVKKSLENEYETMIRNQKTEESVISLQNSELNIWSDLKNKYLTQIKNLLTSEVLSSLVSNIIAEYALEPETTILKIGQEFPLKLSFPANYKLDTVIGNSFEILTDSLVFEINIDSLAETIFNQFLQENLN